MLFNSTTFCFFLTLTVILYYSIQVWSIRKCLLLLCSYLFYAAWNPSFVVLLWISTLIDWNAAKKIHQANNKTKRKLWLLLSLLTNLGLLAFFKYGNFIIENINFLSETLHLQQSFDRYSIILPVGISFYTFQTLSYTIDIYRRQAKTWHSFLDYALYVTFFPQLVAGPIVRSGDFLKQCVEEKKFNVDNLGYGFFWLIVGLFLKMVVADHFLAPIVEKVYQTNGVINSVSAWTGTLAFSGQILCDFAGYSICAIGIALMLGFRLPKNFRFPYAATGFSDFWRRWHISLSTWLRDYLYIPLGGNKQGKVRTYQNLMVTMLIGGLWHGAAWTFVVWGALHGIYLAVERILRSRVTKVRIPAVFRILMVFILVCFTWVFFRAESFGQAGNLLVSMLGMKGGSQLLNSQEIAITFIITTLILMLSFIFRNKDLEVRVKELKWWKMATLLTFMIYAIITLPGEDRSFIYFQF